LGRVVQARAVISPVAVSRTLLAVTIRERQRLGGQRLLRRPGIGATSTTSYSLIQFW
jgi:hypothetical protein